MRRRNTSEDSDTTASRSFSPARAGSAPRFISELDRALTDHELVKIRARVGDRDERDSALAELALATRAELVQRIGHVALFYRANPEKQRIMLPD